MGKKQNCYMDTNIAYIKTDNIYKDIAKNVGTRPVTSNYELGRPLPRERNKK